jgi:hypothetical protein
MIGERTKLLKEGKWVDVSYSHAMYRVRHRECCDNTTDGVLEIRFRNLRNYNYYNVPRDVAKRLINVKSPGKYFAKNILDRYDYEQV